MRYFTNICIVTTVHFYDNHDRIEIRKWTHTHTKQQVDVARNEKNTAADFGEHY